jgi:Flp pilus assembly protein TadG
MSNPRLISPSHRREQGQTIVLVALALVTLLAMAALAIDVVTLYVARSEMQRAADAAALAGAKAFVDSGVTTDPSNTNLQTLAQDMANATISSIVQQNKIAGAPPVLASPPAFSFTNAGNPTLSVTLQRTDLPTFFARIWGSRLATVTASATAEAYNPSNWQTSTGISVAPKCVKPLLIPNKDPGHAGSTFVSATTGTVTLPGIYPAGVIGETFGAPPIPELSDACPSGNPNNPCVNPDPLAGTFIPASVALDPTKELCPSCAGSSDLEQGIECCDFRPSSYSCGGTIPVDISTSSKDVRRDADNGVQCLINASGSGPGQGQDSLDPANFLASSGPMQITANSGPLNGRLVFTSNSIATFPIIDTPITGGQATIVGFLQVFVNYENGTGSSTQVNLTVLNVAGCGNTAGTTVISGGGVSPVPVRLIHQ